MSQGNFYFHNKPDVTWKERINPSQYEVFKITPHDLYTLVQNWNVEIPKITTHDLIALILNYIKILEIIAHDL